MKRTVLDYLEDSAAAHPNKTVFEDPNVKESYKEFVYDAKTAASCFLKNGVTKKKVAVYLDKSVECLKAMFGCIYSNNIYCVLDVDLPAHKIDTILNILNPDVIVSANKLEKKLGELEYKGAEIFYAEDFDCEADEKALERVRNRIIDEDPVYILFTSGSTGIPKGTVVNHRSIISYINSVIDIFKLNDEVKFGSQTPFFFSMSVLDIYATVFCGGTLTVIPKLLFSFPVKLISYLNEAKVNIIYWVPTALSIVAGRNAFSAVKPEFLNYVLFAGEVMPLKPLNYWMTNLKGPLYANLYGPTEITDTGTYYIVDREFSDDETLPIGVPFPNCDVILLTEDNKMAEEGEEGEICFRGSFLGSGYYDNPEKSNEVFCQNPLNKRYAERIYRTGDIGKYNRYGELLYISRKDFQIKKSGYRIELGDIEASAQSIDGINECVCVYDSKNSKIALFYTGSLNKNDVPFNLQKKIAKYMLPDAYIKVKQIPKNPNGKFDRKKLLTEFINGNYN